MRVFFLFQEQVIGGFHIFCIPSLLILLFPMFFECPDVDCIQGLSLWRNSASVINDELFKGYRQRGSGGGKTNEFVAGDIIYWSCPVKCLAFIDSFSCACIIISFTGYDFLNTSKDSLDINIWFNSTYNRKVAYLPIATLRVPRLVNMVCALNYCTTSCAFHLCCSY